MIIERWVFNCKPGKVDEAEELMLAFNWGRPYRLYRSMVGGMLYQLITESEYENMADNEQVWNEIQPKPEFAAFFEKFTSLINSGERTFLTLIETSS